MCVGCVCVCMRWFLVLACSSACVLHGESETVWFYSELRSTCLLASLVPVCCILGLSLTKASLELTPHKLVMVLSSLSEMQKTLSI